MKLKTASKTTKACERIEVNGKVMTKITRGSQTQPVVTISRRKIIFDRFCVENIVQGSKGASLFYSKEEGTLAIQFHPSDKGKDVYKIQDLSTENTTYVFIDGRSFIRTLEGRRKELKRARYQSSWNDKHGMLIIDLKNALSETIVMYKGRG